MRDFIKHYIGDKISIVPDNKKIKSTIVKATPPNTKKEFLKTETIFDFTGNKIEHKNYGAGKVLAWNKYIYQDGKLIEILEGKSKWKGGSYNLTDFNFERKILTDENQRSFEEKIEIERGQKVISTFWEPGKIKCKKVFNDKSICIEVSDFETKGALINKELYNDIGQLIEARRFKSDGTPLNYTTNKYNEKQQLIHSLSISRTGYITYDTYLKYNDKGLITEYIDHPLNPDNISANSKATYDGFGHKYFYTSEKLLDIDELYQCGEQIMSYKYYYEFWN